MIGTPRGDQGFVGRVIVHRGAGAYICGEETALLASLNGDRGQPTREAAVPGRLGRLAQADAPEQRRDASPPCRSSWPSAASGTARSARTRRTARALYSVSGHVNRPGNYELVMSMTFRDVIEDVCGGIKDGRTLKAFVPGGSSTPILTADEVDTGLDYDSIAAAGSMSGSGAVIVLDDRTCMVQFALRTAEFYRHEIVWQVHAVPRGRPLDLRPVEGLPRRYGGGRETSTCCSTSATRSRATASAPRRCLRDAGACDPEEVPARVRDLPGARRVAPRRVVAADIALPDPEEAPADGARLMAATEVTTVTLTIDGNEMVVPKGTPLVVAAAGAGIEIPVFCYEPRLGAPVGACRMCLVEIEMGGRPMPKLQAACTMTVADGMVVKTAATSAKADKGQESVLEFLLINHPLDCPVCDKGGECPLQDLTFRYGPGNSRMRFPKRTYEKPLPISPSIVLDRERCILCYRCTRFSSDVAEDGELIARERGARSVIATFEEQPYVGVFSGNVTELCPVGALLPTAYRFKSRPWEISNVPTVCGGCSVGCNTWITVRDGEAQRVVSRNHPEVDEGWLCDRGRFARIPVADRLHEPLIRGERGLEPVSFEDATRTAAQRLRHVQSMHGAGAVAIVTGGDLTNEEAFAWSLIAQSVGARTAAAPVAAAAQWDLLAPYAARIADLDTASVVVVVGDAEMADRAGVVDLRVRKARRRGAHLAMIGAGGAALERDAGQVIQTPAGCAAQTIAALRDGRGDLAALADRVRAAEGKAVLIATDAVDHALLASAAHALGCRVLGLPRGPNERGAYAVGLRGGGDEVLAGLEDGTVRAIVMVGVDPTAEWPESERWQMALAGADVVGVRLADRHQRGFLEPRSSCRARSITSATAPSPTSKDESSGCERRRRARTGCATSSGSRCSARPSAS